MMTPDATLAAWARDSLQKPVFHTQPNRAVAAIMAGAVVWTVARRA